MMKRLLIITLATGLLISCNRNTDPLGPGLDEIYGPFSVLEDFEVSDNRVDFGSGENLQFTCRFSKTVDWEIHILGEVSGAEKVLSGKSKVVDENTGLWDGTTTIPPMFKEEGCWAYITVPEEGFSDTIMGLTIDSTRSISGFVVADFENGINPGWTTFAQSGANMSWNIVESNNAAQSGHYFDMGGEVSWDWLIGLIDFPASAYNEAAFPLSDNPDQVYFNAFFYVPEGITNEVILLQFSEDENENGSFQSSSEDMYSIELRGLDSGWQLFSIRYSDLTALTNGQPSTPAGNEVHEPNKLLQVSLLFLANPASGYSQSYVDYIIFTENQPLQP